MMESMGKKEPEKYQEFYDEFGEVLKEGAGEDFANRESISKLLRFASTKGEGDKKKACQISPWFFHFKPLASSVCQGCANADC